MSKKFTKNQAVDSQQESGCEVAATKDPVEVAVPGRGRRQRTGKRIGRCVAMIVVSMLFLCPTMSTVFGQCTITGLKPFSVQTPDSVSFKWDQLLTNTGPYQYYYSTLPILNPDSIQFTNDATQDSVSLIGLCGGTTYYLFVAGQCADPTTDTWDTLQFVTKCFPVVASSLTVQGLGVYCSGAYANIGMNGYEQNQSYTWNQSGKPVKTIAGNDPTAGSGGNLSWGFNVANSGTNGIYSIKTVPLCGTCGASDALFGALPIYFDSVGGIQTTQVTGTSVTFKWNAIVAGETYLYAVDADPTGPYGTVDTTNNLFGTIQGLSPGTTYTIFVEGACDDGYSTRQGWGNWYTITFATLPANHTCSVKADTLTGTGVYCPGTSLTLKIPLTQINQNYILLRNGQHVDSARGTGAVLNFSYPMQASLAGTYTVLTNDTCNCCTALPFGNAVVGYDSVSGLAATVTANSVSFHWNSVAPGATYRYGVSTSAGAPPTGTNITTTTTTNATIPGLNAGTSYYLFVASECDNGVGASTPGPWDTLAFTTSAAVVHTCNVQAGTLTGAGIYCSGSSVTVSIPQTQSNQFYLILKNGVRVDSVRGNGGAYNNSFPMQPANAGTYTVVTGDTCNCCSRMTFGSVAVSFDAITGLVAGPVTASTVSFEWNSVATGATYQYGISPSATADPASLSTATATSAVESTTRLSPATTYYIYVRGQCDDGGGTPGWGNWDIVSFTTPASTVHTCNVQAGALTGSGIYCQGSSVTLSIPVTQGNQAYTIGQNGQTVFAARGNSDGSALSYTFVMQGPAQAGGYTVMTSDTCNCCSPVSFGSAVVSFDAITGLTAGAVTASTVSFQWNSVATGATYQYGISPSDAADPASLSTTTTTNATESTTGLSPATTYYIYVRGQCDNGGGTPGWGNWDIVSFTTPAATTHACNVQAGTLTGAGNYCPGSAVTLSIPVTQGNQAYTIEQNGRTVFSDRGNSDGSTVSYNFVMQGLAQAGVYTVMTSDTCNCCSPLAFGSVVVSFDTITGLATGPVTASSVSFQWNSVASGATYQYGISPGATADPASLSTTTATNAAESTTGLSPATTYYIYVRGQCDNGGGTPDWGNWDIVSFTTQGGSGSGGGSGGIGSPCDTIPVPVAKLFDDLLGSSSLTGNQWFLNDTLIPGATNYGYTPTQPGSYTVQVTVNGCVTLSAPVTVGSSDLASPNVRIFPNPVTTQITIDNLGANAVTIQLFDLTGRQVSSIGGIRGVYLMSSGKLAKGLYVIKITDEKTNHKTNTLLVKI